PDRERRLRLGCASERVGQLGRRACPEEEVVDALEALALASVETFAADQVFEVGPGHASSPSRRSASRARPLRVRVLTVPSGISRNWATSLWERPLQYASSSTARSLSGSSASARWTRHETHAVSAPSA